MTTRVARPPLRAPARAALVPARPRPAVLRPPPPGPRARPRRDRRRVERPQRRRDRARGPERRARRHDRPPHDAARSAACSTRRRSPASRSPPASPASCSPPPTLAAGRALISGALEAWFVDEARDDRPRTSPLHRPLAQAATAEAVGARRRRGRSAACCRCSTRGLPEHGDDAAAPALDPAPRRRRRPRSSTSSPSLRLVDEPRRRGHRGWRDARRDRPVAGLQRGARQSRNVRLLLGVAARGRDRSCRRPSCCGSRGSRTCSAATRRRTRRCSAPSPRRRCSRRRSARPSSPRVAALAGTPRASTPAPTSPLAAGLALLGRRRHGRAVLRRVPRLYWRARRRRAAAPGDVSTTRSRARTARPSRRRRAWPCQVGGVGGNLMLVPLAGERRDRRRSWGIAALFALGAAGLAAATRPRAAAAQTSTTTGSTIGRRLSRS